MNRKVFLLVFAIGLLFLAGCSSQSAPAGSGVQTSILNRAELSNIYVPLSPTDAPLEFQPARGFCDDESCIEIAELNLLVHNRGYADSLVALYVTGFDPNLFTVAPKGPFVLQGDSRYCYRDIILKARYDYSVFASCSFRDDVFVGGGVDSDGEDDQRLIGSVYNIGPWLDTALGWVGVEDSTFFQTVDDILGGVYIDCEVPTKTPDGQSARAQCSFSSGFTDYLNRRNTRGSLLLALHSQDVNNCQNDCVLVPSPRLPRNYIAGDTESFPGGEQYVVDYGIYLNEDRWPSNYYEHDQLFQVSACYLYTTYATPISCIDAAPQSNNAEICRPGVQQINHGQPAPLRITHIEQQNQGPRVMFTIHVENQLGGTVFHPGAVDFCAPGSPESYGRQLRDVAQVIDARVIGDLKAMDCRDGKIRMQNGRGQITCFYDIPSEAYRSGAYQTSLNIEIGYLYRDVQTVQATIHRI